MTPPPLNGGRGPLPVPNEQLTVEQLKQRTEKLGKLKNLSSLIYPQSNPQGGNESVAPAAKRGRGAANQGGPMPPGSGPPFMNGPNDMMYGGNGMPGQEQFNQMMPGGYGGPPPQQQQQQDWNKLSNIYFVFFVFLLTVGPLFINSFKFCKHFYFKLCDI
jgi:hypothetical protein